MKSSVSHFIRNNTKFLLYCVILMNFAAIVLGGFYYIKSSQASKNVQPSAVPAEIEAILTTRSDKLQVDFYKKLIERVGPVQAQEDLYHSGLPFDGQSHLLNHTVGDWLYTKYATTGLAYCKDYFLSSCYHGFLIRFIADKGINNLDEVMQGCWKTSSPTASQCAHGIGHGLLAWEGYKNLPLALQDCDKVAALSKNFPTYNCYDGAFMENNWAVHDDGKPSEDRWVKESDPTFPCYDSRIAEKYRRACWSNQPQVMYKLFQGDVKKVAAECERIKATAYQDTCFDSLARQLNPVAHGDVNLVFSLCNNMPVGWKNSCVTSNVSAFFSVGDRDIPFTLCAMIPESGREACYEVLQQRISSYTTSVKERLSLCARVPQDVLMAQYCPTQ